MNIEIEIMYNVNVVMCGIIFLLGAVILAIGFTSNLPKILYKESETLILASIIERDGAKSRKEWMILFGLLIMVISIATFLLTL